MRAGFRAVSLSLCHWAVGSGVEKIAEAVLNGTASDYYVRLYG